MLLVYSKMVGVVTQELLDELSDFADPAASEQRFREQWMLQALPLAANAPDARTQRWLVSLHNNLGWFHFDRADFDQALMHFEHAAKAAHDVGTFQQQTWAAEAIEECRAAMAPEAPIAS